MTQLALAEFHPFEAAGRRYVYLVPSAAVFGLDEASGAVLDTLAELPRSASEVATALRPLRGVGGAADDRGTGRRAGYPVGGGARSGAGELQAGAADPAPDDRAQRHQQVQPGCTYCYEYGEDKIKEAAANPLPRFMSEETARQTADFAWSMPGRRSCSCDVLRGRDAAQRESAAKSRSNYARAKAAEMGKYIDFGMTTNATILDLRDHRLSLRRTMLASRCQYRRTEESKDRFPGFSQRQGAMTSCCRRSKSSVKVHRSRPIGARVTLTAQVVDVKKIFRHLTDEMGFRRSGICAGHHVAGRLYAIGGTRPRSSAGSVHRACRRISGIALEDRHHGFSNVRDTLQEIHQGMSKAYPCGQVSGCWGWRPSAIFRLCHRFADRRRTSGLGEQGSQPGDAAGGHPGPPPRGPQVPIVSVCWARPVCSGGCYHEAYTVTATPRHRTCTTATGSRHWTDVCFRIYGEIGAAAALSRDTWVAGSDVKAYGGRYETPESRSIEKRAMVEEFIASESNDVRGAPGTGRPPGPHIPLGCSFVFSPGWEADSSGGTRRVVPAGRARPFRLLSHLLLARPRAGPLQLRAGLDRQMRFRAQKDWRNIDLVFP